MNQYAGDPNLELIVYGIILSLIIFLLWIAFRLAKSGDKKSLEITVDEVLNYYRDKITSDDFLWAVQHQGASFGESILSVKDAKGKLVARIRYYGRSPAFRTIEIGEKKFERIKENKPFSNRLFLHEVDSGKILMSCVDNLFKLKQEYCEGEGELLKFTLHYPSILHDPNSHVIKMDDGTLAGNLFEMKKFKCGALLLNISMNKISRIEQLFILANL